MMHVLTNVLLLLILFFMVACPGLKFLRLIGMDKRPNLELFVLSTSAGFAILTEALLIAGMLGFFQPLIICLILIGLFLLSVTEARFFLRCLINAFRSFRFFLSLQHFLIVAFAVFLVINILKALLPPHGPTDVLFYHLTIPKLYLAHGSLVTHPTLFPSFFPSNGEVLFSLSLLLGGPVFVNLTVFGFGILTVMALYVFAQKYVQREFALVPGIIYLTAPVVNSWGTMAYTDTILAFYLFLTCMLLMEYDNQTRWRETIMVGIFAGMALGTKYQAIGLLGVMYVGLFFIKMRRWRRMWALFATTVALGVIVASPWFLRNLLVIGNPFYPLLQDIFSPALTSTPPSFFTPLEAKEILQSTFKKLSECYFLPFSYFWSGAIESEDFQRSIGPLFLGITPFVFFLQKRFFKWPILFLVVLLSYSMVGLFSGNIRYFIILVLLLSFLCGAVVQETLTHAKRNGRIILVGSLFLVIVFYTIANYHLMLSHKRILAALHPKFAVSFLRTFEQSYKPAEWANRNLPDDAKVLFHGTVRYYYFKFEPFNDYRGQPLIVYDEARNGADVLRIMDENGFTHIICQDTIPENAYVHTIRYEQEPRLKDFADRYLKKLYSGNGMSIYQIMYP